jgi:threonine synthase
MIREGDRVVLVNTASPEKYLATIRDSFDGGL